MVGAWISSSFNCDLFLISCRIVKIFSIVIMFALKSTILVLSRLACVTLIQLKNYFSCCLFMGRGEGEVLIGGVRAGET